MNLGAEIVVKLRASNLCSEQDLADEHMTIEQMFRSLASEEGLFGICDDDYEILSVTKVEEP